MNGSSRLYGFQKRTLEQYRSTGHADAAPPQKMRNTRMWAQENWLHIWRNLAVAPISEDDKAVWYRTIHDILPTNERLHRIKISPTDKCDACDVKDTVMSLLYSLFFF